MRPLASASGKPICENLTLSMPVGTSLIPPADFIARNLVANRKIVTPSCRKKSTAAWGRCAREVLRNSLEEQLET
jgi:hypothetical protein